MLVALKRGVHGPGRYSYGKLLFERLNGGQDNTVHEVDDETGAMLVNTGWFEIRSVATKPSTAAPARGDRVTSRARAATQRGEGAGGTPGFPEDDLTPPLTSSDPHPTREHLAELTYAELMAYAKGRKVKLVAGMKKTDVIDAVLAANSATDEGAQ